MDLNWIYSFGIDPGMGTIIGGGFVMVAAYQASKQAERQREFDLLQHQLSVKGAITAEMKLIVRQIRDRSWIASLEGAISARDRSLLPGGIGPIIHTPLGRHHVKIYDANLQNIAALGKHTQDLVEFYSRVEAAIEINEHLRDIMGGVSYLDVSQGHKLMKVLRDMLVDIAEIGDLLVQTIDNSISSDS